ncbi:MAG: glycosyltransferase family 2 protein [Solobacterium sp.]|nr:glycosyltransferase family 2 protein [Solobacterium sp.]
MAQVTVIVPIYNVEKYLRACFESLLQQTSDDFVVLAINDGSPDASEEIIKEYVAKYPDKIYGIKKENGGYGSVLQVAFKELKTPYFLVCDPDDTLAPNAVEKLLELARLSNADLTIGAKTFVYDGKEEQDYDPAYNREFATLRVQSVYNQGDDDFADLFFVDPSPHAKLYRKSLVKDIQFPEKVGYTDNLLFYISLLNSKKVIYTDESLANYLIDRPGNTMTDVSYKALNGQILVFKTILAQAEKLNPIDMFYYRMFESFKYMLYQTRRLNCDEQQYGEIMDYLETFLQSLLPKGKIILPLYKKYTKNERIERLKDEALLTKATSHLMYQQMKKAMTKAFLEHKKEG